MGGLRRGGRDGAILVLGATSGIARAVAEIWMARGEDLVLAGRSPEALEALARDLEAAFGRRPRTLAWDVADLAGQPARLAELAAMGPLRGALVAAGVLHAVAACDADPAKEAESFAVNLAGPAAAAGLLARHLADTGGRGAFVSCLSSVAGDRGRASNYPYGSAKAGLTAYLEGLRYRMQGRGVLIQTVKPGPVRTRMTAGTRQMLLAEPEAVARDIARAIDAGREVVYTPGIWRPIMAILRLLPSAAFRRLPL